MNYERVFTKKGKDTYLTFLINKKSYAIEVPFIKELTTDTNFSPLPNMNNFMIGVFSLSTHLFNLIDLSLFLTKEKSKLNFESCTIVVEDENKNFAFFVDKVFELKEIFPEKITFEKEKNYIKGYTKEGVTILDIYYLLNTIK